MDWARILRGLRKDAGLSLRQISEKLDLKSKNAWARYEQGRCVPTIKKLEALLDAVGYELTLRRKS